MAAQIDLTKNRASIKLTVGSTASGAPKTASVNLGTLSPTLQQTTENAQKIINIVNALVPCLTNALNQILWTTDSELYEE